MNKIAQSALRVAEANRRLDSSGDQTICDWLRAVGLAPRVMRRREVAK